MQMQAVLYLLATKFLTTEELNIVKEELNMTYLGELLMQDGFEKGLLEGKIHMLIELICRKLEKSETPKMIAAELESDEAFVLKICEAAKDCGPDYDSRVIYKKLNL